MSPEAKCSQRAQFSKLEEKNKIKKMKGVFILSFLIRLSAEARIMADNIGIDQGPSTGWMDK